MLSDDIVIAAQDLSKSYRLFAHPGDRVKEFLTFGLKQYHRRYEALVNATFDIRKGESVGIIGRNGSGKSTLLQLICGILKPSYGEVSVKGKVSALLELGAGFNPEFTGRENVYFQGAVSGLSKAMVDERFDDIAAFADIGEFLDQPVRTYSSGMFVRLAFAAMIHADSDILVIDEALAVGDGAFQRKCFDKLASYLEEDRRTLLFVSHHLHQVERLCTRAIWLDQGRIVQNGIGKDVCTSYLATVHDASVKHNGEGHPQPNIASSGEIDVSAISMFREDDGPSEAGIEQHSSPRIVVDFTCFSSAVELEIVIGFDTPDSILVAAANTAKGDKFIQVNKGQYQLEVTFPRFPLTPGIYYIRLVFRGSNLRPLWIGHRQISFRVDPKRGTSPLRMAPGLVSIPFNLELSPVYALSGSANPKPDV